MPPRGTRDASYRLSQIGFPGRSLPKRQRRRQKPLPAILWIARGPRPHAADHLRDGIACGSHDDLSVHVARE